MHFIGIILALVLIVAVLIDGFETILQPRRVVHQFRYARFYYRSVWFVWRHVSLLIPVKRKRREAFLSVFGPLSMLGLFATWVAGLIVGFALLNFSVPLPLHGSGETPGFLTYMYFSGTTFFTLGYGDLTPAHALGRALAVVESGMGFAFLAVLISYLPVLYQAFSKREVIISLLDARAGSPPSASEVLLRLGRSDKIETVDAFLRDWELWAAELLESHLSFPVLSFYRSQHDNQSWLAALTTILDTSALLLVMVKETDAYQAQLTFAMARHSAVDLALVLSVSHRKNAERLSPEQFQQLRSRLTEAGVKLHDYPDMEAKLTELRRTYEPFLYALSQRLMLTLPPICLEQSVADNWQRSSWMQLPPGIGSLPMAERDDDHF
jgi:PIN domain nuclease of toxin-antitoxin system